MVEEAEKTALAAGSTQLCPIPGRAKSPRESFRTPLCPNCAPKNTKVWKAGFLDNSSVQRWQCSICGKRFTVLIPKGLNVKNTKRPSSQQNNPCRGIELLAPQAEIKSSAGDKRRLPRPKKIDTLPEVQRGFIVEFMAYLERNGFDNQTTYPTILTHLAGDGADLLDPEAVKSCIAKQIKEKIDEPWSDSMKLMACCAYEAFLKMKNLTWVRPRYVQNEATIMVPDEKDLDILINAVTSKRMSAFLLCLKETFGDPQEIISCRWSDLQDNILSINHPVKHHYPGKYELSIHLLHMLNALPRKAERIFPTDYRSLAVSFSCMRRRIAARTNNPALLRISFKSFRHWGGSMLAFVTNGNVPEIAKVLRHKSWASTQKYVHTITNLREDDYETTAVSTLDEVLRLGKDGWSKYDEVVFNGVIYHCYRKPKRFGCLQKLHNKSENKGIGIYL